MTDYRSLLLSKSKKIGVWGAGYIGYSTMAHFARHGVACIGVDVDPNKVEAINKGEVDIVGLRDWLGFDTKSLTEKGLIKATPDYQRLLSKDILVHFVCIPTEKDGKPFYEYLEDVITKLSLLKDAGCEWPPLVIIESTLTPGTTDEFIIPTFHKSGLKVGTDMLLGVAPRRDWFVENTKSLKELDRVFGGCDKRTTQEMAGVLSIVCDHLHTASNQRTAEMVKSVENAYRHMEITLANQLSLAYPNENMREVLQLAGTKWNIGTFYPGFGTGGYCIPLSSQYVLEGAEHRDKLSILSETVKTDQEINRIIAQSLVSRGFKRIGVLGLSYKGNLKVHILSPTIPFVSELKKGGVQVKLFDPYYSLEEVSDILGVETFLFPDELGQFDAVVLTVDHQDYKLPPEKILPFLSGCRFILDNVGIWKDYDFKASKLEIEYLLTGEATWLGHGAY